MPTLPSLHGHVGEHSLLLRLTLKREDLGHQRLNQQVPDSCIKLSKNASMAHTAVSGNFSHQERQVQPDDHVDSITPGGGRQDTTPPRVASDLVCVLHFISNFYKTEDLFQLCHQHCFRTCAHYVSVTIRDSHKISNSSLLYLVW